LHDCMAGKTINASARIVAGPTTDVSTAFMAGWEQPNMRLAREALIIDHDPRLFRRHSITKDWYASPGLSKPDSPGAKEEQLPLERDFLVAAQKDEFGRQIIADLRDIPANLAGLKIPLVTFEPLSIYWDSEKVVVTPELQTLRPSIKAPSKSKWSRIHEDMTFEEIDNETRKSLQPIEVAYPWINEDPSVGGTAVYGEAGGQGIQLFYPPDFRGQYLRMATAEETERQLSGKLITEVKPIRLRQD
jgi:hypothetical protein